MKFYAYILGSKSGICASWDQCKSIVHGKDARYKSFKTKKEAEDWIKSTKAGPLTEFFESSEESRLIQPGLYFDAGTGRGNGVEVSVTDEKGNNLLDQVADKNLINQFGKLPIAKNYTNNYGELLACYFALNLALKLDIKKIFGDSKLVIDYWSKGQIYIDSKETIELAEKTSELRKAFESKGGKIAHISGKYNPADLGFHK